MPHIVGSVLSLSQVSEDTCTNAGRSKYFSVIEGALRFVPAALPVDGIDGA